MQASQTDTPNSEKHYTVSQADLPLQCPAPQATLWNSHPRVFLPIVENGGQIQCPYCGAEYRLQGV